MSTTFFKAHDRNRTGDLFLTKDVLCRLSYMGDCNFKWSGKRDSNPRPSAWKADALPLSYSRTHYIGATLCVCPSSFGPVSALAEAGPHKLSIYGGEGRIRTFEGRASGFTARPLWPLGYLSKHLFPGATEGIRTPDPLITNQ